MIYVTKTYTKDCSLYKLGYTTKTKGGKYMQRRHNPGIEIISSVSFKEDEIFEKEFHENTSSYVMNKWYSVDKLRDIARDIVLFKDGHICDKDDYASCLIEFMNDNNKDKIKFIEDIMRETKGINTNISLF